MGGWEGRKSAGGDLGQRKGGFGVGEPRVTERGELRATANGRAVDDADYGLRRFKDADEDGVERVEHLKHAIGCVFTDVNAAAENLAGGIEEDEFHVGTIAGVGEAVHQSAG